MRADSLPSVSGERFSLKDQLFNEGKLTYLGGLLGSAIPRFERDRFETEAMAGLVDLELKERIGHISRVLEGHLDPDFEIAAGQIRASLPPPLDPSLQDGDFGDFIFAPLGKYVEDHGLHHPDTSLPLLRELTMRFSMEGPIRPFLDSHPEITLRYLSTWVGDDNYHVRRLVSEGTRPRLPWAPRIKLDIRTPLPLLETLHADPTRYVTRSVANHLNDITKIDPALALGELTKWHASAAQEPVELGWITRHALRTLTRKGDPAAMRLLGYSPQPGVSGSIVESSSTVRPGGALEFDVRLEADRDEKLIVDYAIGFVKKSGAVTPKVFKLKRLVVSAGDTLTLHKRHPLRDDATTYTLHPGRHTLTVTVNGVEVDSAEFEVDLG